MRMVQSPGKKLRVAFCWTGASVGMWLAADGRVLLLLAITLGVALAFLMWVCSSDGRTRRMLKILKLFRQVVERPVKESGRKKRR